MGVMTSQTTSLAIVYSTIHSGADQRKHQSCPSLAFVRRIHRWPVNSQHKGLVTRKIIPFDVVIISPTMMHYWAIVKRITRPLEDSPPPKKKKKKMVSNCRPSFVLLFVGNQIAERTNSTVAGIWHEMALKQSLCNVQYYRWGVLMHICVSRDSCLVLACRLSFAQPFSEPMMAKYRTDRENKIQLNLYKNIKMFVINLLHWRHNLHLCPYHMRNLNHFVSIIKKSNIVLLIVG